jgi:hypothetical protein
MSPVRRRPSGLLEKKDRSVSVRLDTTDWDLASTRARSENVRMSTVMSTLVDGYGRGRINPVGEVESRTRRPNGSADGHGTSFRMDQVSWALAVDRAAAIDASLSDVVANFVRAYGQGRINLPRVQVVYDTVPVSHG